MTATIESIKRAAEEAEFQVLATIDICNWVAAIARAIARDVDTGGGRDVPALTDLAKFFEDSGVINLQEAFKQFKQIAVLNSAPQNAKSENVAWDSEVRP